MWSQGQPLDYGDRRRPPPPPPVVATTNVTFDALSIGSAAKSDLIRAQADTWGSYRSVRYFFGATEADDADPSCHSFLNETTMVQISEHCHSRRHRREHLQHSPVHRYWSNRYAYPDFLRMRAPGWICAQKRFAFALRKLGRFYRAELDAGRSDLPDYLLFQDDDTVYDMPLLEGRLVGGGRDPSRDAFAEAGCLFRVPVDMFNFTFPWGGFGFVLSRAAVRNLIRPVHCGRQTANSDGGDNDRDAFERHVCARVRDNYLGEGASFRDGMSVSDLMGAHAEREPFSNFRDWNPGYCLHGDWVVGYYINYYHITAHVKDPLWKDVPELRIESNFGEKNATHKTQNCRNWDEGRCLTGKNAVFCHRQTADSMRAKVAQQLMIAPDKFRTN